MPEKILIVTSHSAFGKLLRISLEDSGSYRVVLARNSVDALAYAGREALDLLIVDANSPDQPLEQLVQGLLGRQQGVRWIVIPPDNDPNHPALMGLSPDGYLNRPFYIPDLLQTVENVMKMPRRTPLFELAVAPEIDPPQTQDVPHEVELAAQYLTRLLLESSAHAALIMQNGTVWAYAGHLTQPGTEELASLLVRVWGARQGDSRRSRADLVRFVRLETVGGEFMLYATSLLDERILALIYDVTMPLSRIRSQSTRLARALVLRMSSPLPDILSGEFASQPKQQVLVEAQSQPKPAVRQEAPKISGAVMDDSGPLWLVREGEEQVPAKSSAASQQTTTRPDVQVIQTVVESLKAPEAETVTALVETNTPAAEPEQPQAVLVEPAVVVEPIPNLPESPAGASTPEVTAAPLPAPVRVRRHKSRWYYQNRQQTASEIKEEPPAAPVEKAHQPETAASHLTQIPQSPAGQPFSPDSTGAALIHAYGWEDILSSQTSDPRSKKPEETPEPASILPESALPWEGPGANDNFDMPTRPILVSPPPPPPPPVPPASQEEDFAAWTSQEQTQVADYMAKTRPGKKRHRSAGATPAAEGDLCYTCILVPRFQQHYLVSELASLLSLWLPELSEAFGWRLEGMTIRPEYLQWTVRVAPAISPGNLMRIIRQRTSQRIFSQFPAFRISNPSGDFWAPGYLIVSGSQPPAKQLLDEFIQQNRRRQGTS